MADAFDAAKRTLLASGLPLEATVERILADAGFHSVERDFSYWRQHAPEQYKDFTVDLRAEKSLLQGSLKKEPPQENDPPPIYTSATWQVLVECKYKRHGVKWIFTPHARPSPRHGCNVVHRIHHYVADTLDFGVFSRPTGFLDPTTPGPLSDYRCGTAHDGPKPVTRGAEMRDREDGAQDAYSTPIRGALSQLLYGHVPLIRSRIRGHALRPTPPTARHLSVEIDTMLLVTTAELWVFSEDVGLDSVLKAKQLDEIAQRVTAVEFVGGERSYERRTHDTKWLRAIENGLSADKTQPAPKLWQEVRESVERERGRSVLIVELSALSNLLESQMALLRKSLHGLYSNVDVDGTVLQFVSFEWRDSPDSRFRNTSR